ncbi:WhiB family transcriptional regulator [Streptomyces sp. NPDC088736]|uniref:WhiB family transcriptional regulator n=1 Tax=Streptomyces sp. NPDC088736 TaxID=3365881 RepID=UPI0038040565
MAILDLRVPRIPLPSPTTQTGCRTDPQTFDVERGEVTDKAAADRIRRAKATCRTCPIAEACLRWALAHPDLSRGGIWAATTDPERAALRRRLEARLGQDWVNILAANATTAGPHR